MIVLHWQQSTILDDKKSQSVWLDSLPVNKILSAPRHFGKCSPSFLYKVNCVTERGTQGEVSDAQVTPTSSPEWRAAAAQFWGTFWLQSSSSCHDRSITIKRNLFSATCVCGLIFLVTTHFNPSLFPQDHPLLPSYPVPMVNRKTQRGKASWSSQQRLLIAFNCFSTSVSFKVFDTIVQQW